MKTASGGRLSELALLYLPLLCSLPWPIKCTAGPGGSELCPWRASGLSRCFLFGAASNFCQMHLFCQPDWARAIFRAYMPPFSWFPKKPCEETISLALTGPEHFPASGLGALDILCAMEATATSHPFPATLGLRMLVTVDSQNSIRSIFPHVLWTHFLSCFCCLFIKMLRL